MVQWFQTMRIVWTLDARDAANRQDRCAMRLRSGVCECCGWMCSVRWPVSFACACTSECLYYKSAAHSTPCSICSFSLQPCTRTSHKVQRTPLTSGRFDRAIMTLTTCRDCKLTALMRSSRCCLGRQLCESLVWIFKRSLQYFAEISRRTGAVANNEWGANSAVTPALVHTF